MSVAVQLTRLVLVCAGLGSWAHPAAAEPVPASVVDAAITRLQACLPVEAAPLSDEQLEGLREAAGRGLMALGPHDCTTSPAQCVDAVATVSCDELATQIALGAGLVALPAAPEPPPWATAMARTLVERALVCAAAEPGPPLTEDEMAQARASVAQVASVFAAVASLPGCVVDENRALACAAAQSALPCEAMLQVALPDPDAPPPTGPCATWLTCDIELPPEAQPQTGSATGD